MVLASDRAGMDPVGHFRVGTIGPFKNLELVIGLHFLHLVGVYG